MSVVFAETIVITGAGSVLGLATTWWSTDILRFALARIAPFKEIVQIDSTVAIFAITLAVTTAVGCSIVIVLLFPTRRVSAALTAGVLGSGGKRSSRFFSRSVVAAQSAITVMLLTAGVMAVLALRHVSGPALGFVPSGVGTMKVSIVSLKTRSRSVVEEALTELRSIPDVRSLSASTSLPMAGHSFGFVVSIKDQLSLAIDDSMVGVDAIASHYFATMGVPLREGREFDERDSVDAPEVAVVNETFARTRMRGETVVGRFLSLGGGPSRATIRIVGVVADIRDSNPLEPPQAAVYRPFSQSFPQLGWHTLALVARTQSVQGDVSQSFVGRVARSFGNATVYDVMRMDDRIGLAVVTERQRAIVIGAMALMTLVLAIMGVLGLVSSILRGDRRGFAIRLALGSSRRQLLAVVLSAGVTPVISGTVSGCIGSLVLSQAFAEIRFGQPTSALAVAALVSSVAVLLIATFAACLPARRLSSGHLLTSLYAE